MKNKNTTIKKALVVPSAALASMLLLTQCGADNGSGNDQENAGSAEQQEVANVVEELHRDVRAIELDLSDDAVNDILENEQESEEYPALSEGFEDVAEEYFSIDDLDDDQMFELNVTLAVLNETLQVSDSEELPIRVPAESVEIEEDTASAYLLLTEEEMTEEDYEGSEDFSNYEEYVDFSIENEQADIIELENVDDTWKVIF